VLTVLTAEIIKGSTLLILAISAKLKGHGKITQTIVAKVHGELIASRSLG
jgi:hypothetical protein